MLVPITSLGIRSGVNWIRLKGRLRQAAKHWASRVLAVPGTPSSSTWPSARAASNIRSTATSWPTTTRLTCRCRRCLRSRMAGRSIEDLLSETVDASGHGEDALALRGGALGLAGDHAHPAAGHHALQELDQFAGACARGAVKRTRRIAQHAFEVALQQPPRV